MLDDFMLWDGWVFYGWCLVYGMNVDVYGDIGDGPMQSKVLLVPVLLEPRQKKLLGHHGRVGFLFWSCV
jgi:hypothetical protein